MAKTPPPAKPASFEAAVTELEALVSTMEAGELSLDASLAAYARGVELLKFAQGELEGAEAKIKVLDGDVLKAVSPDAI